MKRILFLGSILIISGLMLGACTMSLGRLDSPDSGDDIDTSDEPKGPDSGDDIDTSDEPKGPDSGDDIDTSDEPKGPDSGDDIDTSDEPKGPDSGDDIDTSDEPKGPDSGDEVDINEPTSPDSGDEISLSDDLKNRAKSSCNRISEGSTCVEYIGSYWTTNNAKLNCSSGFAATPCPRPAIGACRIGAETINEIITWHYGYGGDPYTADVVPYASESCKALPGGQWIN